jgi:hypothetical protein
MSNEFTRDNIASLGRTLALGLLVTAGLALAPKATLAEQNRDLHVTKECSQDAAGAAGGFCTITSSNLAAIKVGARVYYDQANGIPTGLLDSNVVLDAGNSNRAIGRCTLDLTTYVGLCTFSDGIGQFAGFHARVDVSYAGGVSFRWDGEYSFSRLDK